jgi:hypothetical protein
MDEVRRYKPLDLRENEDLVQASDSGVQNFSMDFVSSSDIRASNLLTSEISSTKSQIISTTTLLDPSQYLGSVTPSIRAKGIIQFVVVATKAGPSNDNNWHLPSLQLFHDLVSDVECTLLSQQSQALNALKWASPWGKVGLIGLASNDSTLLQEYRFTIGTTQLDGYEFATIPKDVLEPKNIAISSRS